MKDAARRKSTRIPRNSENPTMASSSTRRCRSVSRENTKPGRKRKSSLSEDRSGKRRNLSPVNIPITLPRTIKQHLHGKIIDSYCWICHKVGFEISCESCSRAYHIECLEKKKVKTLEKFCDCHQTSVDGRKIDLPWCPAELKRLLEYAVQEAIKEDKKHVPKSERSECDKFQRFFKNWPSMPANDELNTIMDITVLIDKMNHTPPYQNTGNFFSDVKWIYHNCFIVYGANHEITETALKMEKNFKQEMIDIEACRECYRSKHSNEYLHINSFTRPCCKPHPLVWAKIRGSPYWPAKCLKIYNGHADVRFFGTHDKANILLNQIYKYSKEHPDDKKCVQQKYQDAIFETEEYIVNFENDYGCFQYYKKRTSLENMPAKKRGRKGKSKNSYESPKQNKSASRKKKFHALEKKTSINEELVERKVKVVLEMIPEPTANFREKQNENASNSRTVESQPDETSEVVIQMAFAAEDDNPNDVNMADDRSDQQHSLSGNPKKIYQHSDPSSSVPTNRMPKKVAPVQMHGKDFSNVPSTSSAHLPVIISAFEDTDSRDFTSSLRETPSGCNVLSKFMRQHSLRESSSEGKFDSRLPNTSDNGDTDHLDLDFSDETNNDDDDDDDDDCQVIPGTDTLDITKSAKIEEILKDEGLLKVMTELLMLNKPKGKAMLDQVNSFINRCFLTLWLEANVNDPSTNYKTIQGFYEKFLARIDYLQQDNDRLKCEKEQLIIEQAELKQKIGEYENQEYKKDCVKEMIVSASLQQKKELERQQYHNCLAQFRIVNEKLTESNIEKELLVQNHAREMAMKDKELLRLNKLIHADDDDDDDDDDEEEAAASTSKCDKECQVDFFKKADNARECLDLQIMSDKFTEICSSTQQQQDITQTIQIQNFNQFAPQNIQFQNHEETVLETKQIYIEQNNSPGPPSANVVCESSKFIVTDSTYVTQSVIPKHPPGLVPLVLTTLPTQMNMPYPNPEAEPSTSKADSVSKPKLNLNPKSKLPAPQKIKFKRNRKKE